ncbi:jg3777 [Pararge aegeria aegeria]|uniref:Ubiquitin carboxyl-terminal hydrolase n=1 Tax=Pararge aegeria aegeria TaxID=348720 RepID=A0A8S4SMK7_9NEOP|nr:jg3777 [Pararge aegeria aegeria]
MTETRRSQLHLGKCIEDLDKLHNVPDLKSKRATMLCKTAQKLFESAEEAREKGDEETSYVQYMKYLRVIAYISKDKDYSKDKTYYTSMLGVKNPNKALDAAEKLKNSLIVRYEEERQSERLNDIKENELIKQKIDDNRKKALEAVAAKDPATQGLPGPDEVTIKSEQLYSTLKSGKLKVMILDARPGKDYIESHINHPACISVPEECISPGQTANVLEQNLPAVSRPVWAERASMDLIVMLDWNSSAVIPGKTLYLLKTILLKWDIKVQYSRQPLALRGGYEDWLLKYPAFTTNPRPTTPHQDTMLDDMLGEIDYPNWSDLSPPVVTVNRVAKPSGGPLIDRTSKIAAVQLYDERSRSMQNILEQQERIADTSLTLEMQRLEAEQEDDGDAYMGSPTDSTGAVGLNRSQSSPNIAKLSSDEDEVPMPAFDRSTKPSKVAPSSEMHHRDFQPVWGDVGRGLTGLKNLGNTCYMNSIIQCLNNTAILVTYFCNGQYLEHVNRSHSTRGAIAEELAAVVRALWSGQYRFIATKDLRNEVGKHQRAFRGTEQQDSHEFLTILMDWLHLDLQFTIKPPHKETLGASERAWHEYTKSKESLVLRLFYGQIRSTVRCSVCRASSATYDSFSNLSLELPAHASRCTLADCLKLYLNDEMIPGWNCPNCKEKRDAVKKLDISRLPPVLVIHFKRFYVDPKEYMCNAYRKKQTYIDFPLEDLDMRQFSLQCPGNPIYNLYAVSNHYGSMEGGHYTAYCKSSVYGKWYKYDDHLVTEIPASEVRSSAAYILFYSACSRS